MIFLIIKKYYIYVHLSISSQSTQLYALPQNQKSKNKIKHTKSYNTKNYKTKLPTKTKGDKKKLLWTTIPGLRA